MAEPVENRKARMLAWLTQPSRAAKWRALAEANRDLQARVSRLQNIIHEARREHGCNK